MATATQIISEALGHLGILSAGETVGPDDAETCRTVLNTLADAWNLPSLTHYTSTDGTATLTAGSTSLTIGPGQNISVTRPVRIERGSYVTADGVDYPMDQIDESEYNEIRIKTLGGHVPRVFFYEPGASTGTIRYYPAPGASVVVHHPVLAQFTEFSDLTTDYVLPQGYKRAFVFNLAFEVAAHFDAPVSQFIASQAANSLRLVKRSNFTVPQLDVGERNAGAKEAFLSGYM